MEDRKAFLEAWEDGLIQRYILAHRLLAALKEDDNALIKYWAHRIVDNEIPSQFSSPEAEQDFKRRMRRAVANWKERFAHLEPTGDGLAASGPEDDF